MQHIGGYLQINLKQVMRDHSFKRKIPVAGAEIAIEVFHHGTVVVNLSPWIFNELGFDNKKIVKFEIPGSGSELRIREVRYRGQI
jgi:hypothetical protein